MKRTINHPLQKLRNVRMALLAALFLAACASEPIQHDAPKTEAKVEAAKDDIKVVEQKVAVIDQSPQLKPISTDPNLAEPATKMEGKVVEAAKEAVAHEVKTVHTVEDNLGVAPEKALGWLKNGNTRFVKHRLRSDGTSSKDLERLATGQHPHSIVLSCSDSRVPPELVFDQKLGEIFVVRTAGESLDSSAIASLEYAVEHLGAKLLVVMGHDSCGAVKAAIQSVEGKSNGSASLDYLVADIKPRLKDVWDGRAPASSNLTVEVTANAKGVAKDLLSRSEIIRARVNNGSLRIESAVYHLQTGEVAFQ